MEQSLTITTNRGETREVRWQVDLRAAVAAQAWAGKQPGLLAEEVEEMGLYFPRWVLTLAAANEPVRCRSCGELLVFRDGAARCVGCTRAARQAQRGQLCWMGHLPMPVADLTHTLSRIRQNPHPGYPLIDAGGALLWLVPVMAFYPEGWPRQQPILKYDPRLFSILGINSPSAMHHIVGGTTMCLYGGEPWREVPMRGVLQQRVVNHLASMLKIGNGQRPVEAFAGRQHIYDYESYR